MQQLPALLDLCLREKSREYRDVIAFEKLGFQDVFHIHGNEKPASVFKSLDFMTD